jgi:diacylglycerol kinase (ATP)
MRKFLLGFTFASKGIITLISTQRNAKFHLVATLLVVLLAWQLNVTKTEWIALILAVGGVWMAEAFNTALEFVCDRISTERDAQIGRAKDVAAAGVLFISICAAAVGTIIFLPRLYTWL